MSDINHYIGEDSIKKKMGRPNRGYESEKKTLWIKSSLCLALQHQAVDEKRSLSALVNDAIEGYLNNKKECKDGN